MWINEDYFSVDLVRFRDDTGVESLMLMLYLHLINRGKNYGFKGFYLGMAPFYNIKSTHHSSFKNKVMHTVYETGESLYRFQGLQEFKQKFYPDWRPRYMAYKKDRD